MNENITNTLMVYLPVLVWFILLAVVFGILLYKYPFGSKWTKSNMNPYSNETFAMPRGIMRALITLSLLFVVLLVQVVYLNTAEIDKKIHDLMLAFQMMLAFYFGDKALGQLSIGKKQSDQKQGAPQQTQEQAQQQSLEFDTEESVG